MTKIQSGQYAEDVIAATLAGVGLTFHRQHMIGRTVYGWNYYADFFVTNCPGYPDGLVIESKWQKRDGTIDEKFPYLYLNLSRCPYPSIVVVHGGGCREGALAWLRDHCDPQHIVAVYRLEEFMSWLLALNLALSR